MTRPPGLPLLAALLLGGCGASPPPAPGPLAESPEAVRALRSAFARTAARPPVRASYRLSPDGLALTAEGLAGELTRTLPLRAGGWLGLQDRGSGLGLGARLGGASGAPAELAEGHLVYRGAAPDGTLFLRADPGGIEDFLALSAPPPGELVRYELELGELVAGLRLVGEQLEVLDGGGAPRLRMAPPFVYDPEGKRHLARVGIEGCAVDRSPAPPWGRAPVAPGATRCGVTIAWGAGEPLAYPVLVDPSWQSSANMSIERFYHQLVVLEGGLSLVVGGENGGEEPLATAELYDPVTHTWAATGAMAEARSLLVLAALGGGRALAAAGTAANHNGDLRSSEIYDRKSGAWAPLPSMSFARSGPSFVTLKDGRVLVSGGCTVLQGFNGCKGYVASTEIFDPQAMSWSGSGSMQGGRRSHSLTQLPDGQVLGIGGYFDSGVVALVESFSPASGAWSAHKPLLIARAEHSADLLPDGTLAVVGGSDSNGFGLATVEFLPPSVDNFIAGPSLNRARLRHRSILLPAGFLLVAGGSEDVTAGASDTAITASTELLPAASSLKWLVLAPMVSPRLSFATALLPGGSVLAAGGVDLQTSQALEVLSSAERLAFGLPGDPCVQPFDCSSGFCADGVCCDAACKSPCHACSAALKGHGADGACEPSSAGSNPRGGCHTNPPESCQSIGSCDGAGACALVAAGTPCKAPSCSAASNEQSSFACDGAGLCTQHNAPCSPYLCDAAGMLCGASCGAGGCAPGAYCAGGACKVAGAPGAACDAPGQCATGFCADGVCCDTICQGQCEACDAPGHAGTCSPAPQGPPRAGHKPCSGDPGSPCAGACDGKEQGACAYAGAGVDCGSTCEAGAESLRQCAGDGSCKAEAARACGAYACGPRGCAASCAGDADCAAAYTCSPAGACVPRATASCTGDHTSLSAAGISRDCQPYRCSTDGVCLPACDSSADCVQGFTCKSDRSCQPLVPIPPPDAGCALPATPSAPRGPWAAAALLIGAAARRAARRGHPRRQPPAPPV